MSTAAEFTKKINQITSTKDLFIYRQFNPFRVMYNLTEEKQLHSRFIAFMINPKGTHNQGLDIQTKFGQLVKQLY